MSGSNFQKIAREEMRNNNYLITNAHTKGLPKIAPKFIAGMWMGRVIDYVKISNMTPSIEADSLDLDVLKKKLQLEKGESLGGAIFKVVLCATAWIATIASFGILYIAMRRAYLRGTETYKENSQLKERPVKIKRPTDELIQKLETYQQKEIEAKNKGNLKYPEYEVTGSMISGKEEHFHSFNRNIHPDKFDQYFKEEFFKDLKSKEKSRHFLFPTLSKDIKGRKPEDILSNKTKSKSDIKLDDILGKKSKVKELYIPILDGKQYSIMKVDLEQMKVAHFNPGPKAKDTYNKTEDEIVKLLQDLLNDRLQELIEDEKIDDSELAFSTNDKPSHDKTTVWESGYHVLAHVLHHGCDSSQKTTKELFYELVNVYIQDLVETQNDRVTQESESKKHLDLLEPNFSKRPVSMLNKILKDFEKADENETEHQFAAILLYGYKKAVFNEIANKVNFDGDDQKDKAKIKFVAKILERLTDDMPAAVKEFADAYDNAPNHQLKLKDYLKLDEMK